MDRFVRIGEDYLAQGASWFFAFINFLGESWWLWLLLGLLPVALIITLRRVAGMLDEEETWVLSLLRQAATALLNLFFYSFLAGLVLLVVGYYGGSLLYSQHGLDIWWRHITDMSSWFFCWNRCRNHSWYIWPFSCWRKTRTLVFFIPPRKNEKS